MKPKEPKSESKEVPGHSANYRKKKTSRHSSNVRKTPRNGTVHTLKDRRNKNPAEIYGETSEPNKQSKKSTAAGRENQCRQGSPIQKRKTNKEKELKNRIKSPSASDKINKGND